MEGRGEYRDGSSGISIACLPNTRLIAEICRVRRGWTLNGDRSTGIEDERGARKGKC